MQVILTTWSTQSATPDELKVVLDDFFLSVVVFVFCLFLVDAGLCQWLLLFVFNFFRSLLNACPASFFFYVCVSVLCLSCLTC